VRTQWTHAQQTIATILQDNGGLISARQFPALRGSIEWLARSGRLRPVLPGIYTSTTGTPLETEARIAAAALWIPDGVIVGAAAARIGFWPDLHIRDVDIAHPTGRSSRPGFHVQRRRIPADLIIQGSGLHYTCPALAAIDLVRATGDGEAFDVALRNRSTTVEQLRDVHAALPHRRGNGAMSVLLEESRDEPWSPPERKLHGMLRAAGIAGWKANKPTVIDGRRYCADVRFNRLKLAIEVDGYEIHSHRSVFEADRARQNAFVLAGWTVLRFTPRRLDDHPEQVIAEILQAIEMLSR
jgi:very-short-patch-repair endonuclease